MFFCCKTERSKKKRENMKLKLRIEMIPRGCWGRNVRAIYDQMTWKSIARAVKKYEKNRCHICGVWTNRLQAHEDWYFNEKEHVQKLVMIMGVCPKCHNTIHYGFSATRLKQQKKIEKHFMKINQCNYQTFVTHRDEAYERCRRLDAIKDWRLDLSVLIKDGYLIGDICRKGMATYKGFAVSRKNEKQVFWGDTPENILNDVSAWNEGKNEEDQMITCNIGAKENGFTYSNWHNYDVTSRKDISRIYLQLPSMKKEEFQRTKDELKEHGARFSKVKKLWYIEAGDIGLFLKYVPIQEINQWTQNKVIDQVISESEQEGR